MIKVYRIMRYAEKKESFLKYSLLTFAFAARAFCKLQMLSLNRRYDLIQIHNMPDFLVFVGLVHKMLGVPILLDLHDLSVELFHSKWRERKARAFLPVIRTVEKLACRFADHVITTSVEFKKRLIQRGVPARKITLVLNGADGRRFRNNDASSFFRPKNGELELLYHGTAARRFGLHVAIKAVDIVRQSVPGVRLIVYGRYDPSYRAELQGMIARLKMEDCICLNGYVNGDEIVAKIASADIGIVPYLSDPFMDLALSTKTFEYISMHKPVIAARLPSILSLFDENSIAFFMPGNAVDMAEKILRLYRSAAKAATKFFKHKKCMAK
jgi:glycosyltransferase involved in cell wall biosynthesis